MYGLVCGSMLSTLPIYEDTELGYNKSDVYTPEFFVHAAMDKEPPKVMEDLNE